MPADSAGRRCWLGPLSTWCSPMDHSGGVDRVSHSMEPPPGGTRGPPGGAGPPSAAAGTEARRAETRGMGGRPCCWTCGSCESRRAHPS